MCSSQCIVSGNLSQAVNRGSVVEVGSIGAEDSTMSVARELAQTDITDQVERRIFDTQLFQSANDGTIGMVCVCACKKMKTSIRNVFKSMTFRLKLSGVRNLEP